VTGIRLAHVLAATTAVVLAAAPALARGETQAHTSLQVPTTLAELGALVALPPALQAAIELPIRLPARARAALAAGVHGVFHRGKISWYGPGFAGRRTANGERFDPAAPTMAHRQLPFDTLVRVSNPENGRSVVLRVNDRGPFVQPRIADVSYGAAQELGFVKTGLVVAELEVLGRVHDFTPEELAAKSIPAPAGLRTAATRGATVGTPAAGAPDATGTAEPAAAAAATAERSGTATP
jgi:rare lipoprotein A